jgi:hypothetical protein
MVYRYSGSKITSWLRVFLFFFDEFSPLGDQNKSGANKLKENEL